MSTGFNTDIQSILNQVKTQIGSLDTMSAGTSSNNTQFINSVWGLVNQGQQAIDGNDQQKAQVITNIVQNILSMISSLGTKENSAATKEVKANSDKEEKISDNAEEAASEIETEVKRIFADITNNITSISEAMTAIDALGGDKGALAQAKAELEEQVKIIEDNKEILNNGVSSLEAKQKALEAIEGASKAIKNLCTSITGIQKQIEAQNSIVETSANNVSGLMEEVAGTVEGGVEKLQGYIQQEAGQVGVESTSATNGAVNEIVGAKATEIGGYTSWIPVAGQTESQYLIQVGIDQTSAGKARIAGSAKNLEGITKALGEMGSDLQNATSYIGQAQELGNNVVDLIGQYDSKLQPVITATGSWVTVAEGQVQLDAAIEEYKAQTNPVENLLNPWGAGQTDKQNSSEEQNGMFNFDTEVFKKSFGV